jgi:hypothetical protein
VATGIAWRHEHRDLPADHLVTAIAKDALGGGIEDLACALGIDDDDTIGGGLDHRTELRLAIA